MATDRGDLFTVGGRCAVLEKALHRTFALYIVKDPSLFHGRRVNNEHG
jgi:hypothetical protein